MAEKKIYDFSSRENSGDWSSINDVVMGGKSSSNFKIIHSDSSALFSGNVSFENNGGFASVKSFIKEFIFTGFKGVVLKVKGDGKLYSFRVKTDSSFDGINYKIDFLTKANSWIEIKLPFSDFTPTFRGKKLSNVKPLDPSQIQQVGLLISNKQEGSFNLLVDWIKAYR